MRADTTLAQCLYVLTDDNQPAIDNVRANTAYISCLLSIVQSGDDEKNGKAKATAAEERSVMLRVLVSGMCQA
jgi:hypothetical protein